jgi:hypothetical protein
MWTRQIDLKFDSPLFHGARDTRPQLEKQYGNFSTNKVQFSWLFTVLGLKEAPVLKIVRWRITDRPNGSCTTKG